MISQILIGASAAVMLVVAAGHLVATFSGDDLRPQDRELEERMKQVPLVDSDQTTIWRAWLGFNASLCLGLALFGALYGYFAVFAPPLLSRAPILIIGALFLAGMVVIAWRYLFRIPLVVFAATFMIYTAGAVLAVI